MLHERVSCSMRLDETLYLKGPLTLAEGNNGVQTSDNLLQKKGAVKTAAAASEGPLSASSSRSKATKAAQPSERKAADVVSVKTYRDKAGRNIL